MGQPSRELKVALHYNLYEKLLILKVLVDILNTT